MGNYKLIGTDQSVTVYLGNQFDGSINPSVNPAAPIPSSGGRSLQGIAKHVGIKGSLEMTNVKGIGQLLKANRYHSEGAALDLEMFVSAAGFEVPLSYLGCYVTVVHSPLSSQATPFSYVGVLTEWDYDGSEGSEQTLKLTLDLTPDFLPLNA